MNKETLIQAQERISPFIHKTPVLTSELINNICKASVYFKCENFQKTGSFKIRGASNAILNLSQEKKDKGVITHSSGNFAQALSLAANRLNVKASIVMPENAPIAKKNAVKTYNGEIIECESSVIFREKTAEKIKIDRDLTFIHPSNEDDVIIGQATSAMELLEEYPKLDYIFTPVGGGGLIAGTSLACKYFSNNCKVIGGEPKNADDAFRSLKNGKIEYNKTTDTIADGLRSFLGDRNFPIIKKHVNRIILVEEQEIVQAMKLIWERMKIIIEPSSAVAFAAFFKEKEKFNNKNIGIIISGGNVDISNLPF